MRHLVTFTNKLDIPKSLTVLLSLFTFFFLVGCKGPQSILDPAGVAALSIAKLWWLMFIFFSLVFIGIIVLWLYALKPRYKEASPLKIQQLHRYGIIGGGILLPTISILIILIIGIPVGQSLLPNSNHPKALHIDVIGHQWFWEVRYPDIGKVVINELHLPIGQPVDIYATSNDVIHSFWVPRLNGKIDMIPGHVNLLRLNATEIGHFRGQCAEFCGAWHARMILKVEVHSTADFNTWLNTPHLYSTLQKNAMDLIKNSQEGITNNESTQQSRSAS